MAGQILSGQRNPFAYDIANPLSATRSWPQNLSPYLWCQGSALYSAMLTESASSLASPCSSMSPSIS
jgi:hypothetical protein